MKNQHCFDQALKQLNHFKQEDLSHYINEVLARAKSFDSLGSQPALAKAIEEVNKEQLQSFFEEALVTQNNIRKFDALAKALKTEPIDLRSLLAKRYTNDETRRALRKQCAVEEPAIGVGCWAKQATHHAVKSWWEAQA